MTLQANSKVYTISELNSEVQAYLRLKYPTSIWVQGEVKNYNRNAHKDHIFFELCEKDPDSEKILARITAVIFESVKPRLAASLAKIEAGFQLQDDIEVKLECMVDLYPPSGSYQLRVLDIDPTYTLGRIAQQRYAILERLKKEGLLEKNKFLTLPPVPLHVGLISSYNSAAYHDFLKELQESGYAFKVWFVDSKMQGGRVESEVCQALEILNRREDLDAFVIIRGGGARSELAWFDSYKIGQAIAHSRYPVFTGLGHEIDLSVTDLVAHTYKKTPTAVAQFLVEGVSTYLDQLEQVGRQVLERASLSIQNQRQEFSELEKLITYSSRAHIQNARNGLQKTAWQIQQYHNRLIRQTLLQLKSTTERIGMKSILWLKNSSNKMARLWQSLPKLARIKLKNVTVQLEMMEVRRSAVDPIRVLKRGFTISLDSRGKAIRNLSSVRISDVLTTVLTEGQVRSRITEKHPKKNNESLLEIETVLL